MSKVTASCSSCRHQQALEAYDAINVAERPSLKEKVKDGSLFVWECPVCGTHNLAVYKTLYHDPEDRLMVWLLPDGEALDPRTKALEGHLDDYTLRIVRDTGSLVEKVNIWDAGLDDAVMEMAKYVTKVELSRKHGAEMLDIPLRFYRIEGPDHEIVLSFPLDGQMHVVNIGFNVYEDCKAILDRNPDARPATGFAEVDSVWLAKYFR